MKHSQPPTPSLFALGTALLCVAAIVAPATSSAQDDQGGGFDSRPPMEEVVVTGTRIKRRDFSSPSPITTIDFENLLFSGRPTLEEMLNQMPQVMPDSGRTSNNSGDGTARLNLRGLGAGRTLVLINGRRLAPSGVGSAVDVNNLPQALIERVEIITGGATTVYGSDAIAGVVNFITRDDFDGLSIDGSFGVTEKGDAQTSDLNVAYGHNLADDRGNVTVFFSAFDRKALFASEREHTKVVYRDDGQGNLFAAGSFGVPELLIFQPVDIGGSQEFPIFEPDGSFRAFVDPDDQYNFAPINYLQIPLERISVGVDAIFDVSDALEMYTEIGYANNKSEQNLAEVPVFASLTINLDNPVLTPATRLMLADNFSVAPNMASFTYGRRLSELGPRITNHDRDYWRTVIGLRGELVGDWEIDAWATYTSATEIKSLRNSASRSRLAQGLLVDPLTNMCVDPSGGCVPLNVFGAGNISAEGADFIRIDNVQNKTDRTQKLANIVVTGPLLDGWAGSVDAAFGITWRSDEGTFVADEALFTGDAMGFGGDSSIDGSEEVLELYGEAVVPLAGNTAWANYLGLEIGARYSSYENAGEHWTYKLGGEWQPVDGLRLRSMYQRSVRAPNLAELFEEQFTSSAFPFGNMPDPCSASSDPVANGNQEKCIIQGLQSSQIGVFEANTLLPSDYIRGGNPDLGPEEADTYTVGAVFDLNALPKWTIAIDYYDMEVTDTIGSIDALAICFDPLNTANLFCDKISRNASGEVSQIVELTSNRGLLRTKGIDSQLAYTTELPAALAIGDGAANLKLNAVWTHMLDSDMQENPTTRILECAGRFGHPCYDGAVFVNGQTFARNRFTAFANYNSGPLDLHLTWRWIDGTDNAAPLDVRFSGSPDSLAIPNIDDESYVDLGVGYRFSSQFVTRLNINNLFDTDPPQMADAAAGNNTDTGMYDVFGRSYFLSFSADF